MSTESGGSFATLTHARLRAAQGDIGGAVRILRVILSVQPDHEDARLFLAHIENHVATVRREPKEDAPEPVRPATADDLTLRFRGVLGRDASPRTVERLSGWLDRVQRNRGTRHVR